MKLPDAVILSNSLTVRSSAALKLAGSTYTCIHLSLYTTAFIRTLALAAQHLLMLRLIAHLNTHDNC